jgi:hypothetical protein
MDPRRRCLGDHGPAAASPTGAWFYYRSALSADPSVYCPRSATTALRVIQDEKSRRMSTNPVFAAVP